MFSIKPDFAGNEQGSVGVSSGEGLEGTGNQAVVFCNEMENSLKPLHNGPKIWILLGLEPPNVRVIGPQTFWE